MMMPWFDSFVAQRPIQGSDDEGNPMTGWEPLGIFEGSVGSASSRGSLIGGRQDQTIDAYVSTPCNVLQPGDRIRCRGLDYNVVGVKDLRIHYRVSLRTTA